MIVVLVLGQFENRVIRFEVIAIDDTGFFELGEHAIDRRETDILTRAEQLAVDVLRAQVPFLAGLEDLHDLDARQRDLEARFAKLFALQDSASAAPRTAWNMDFGYSRAYYCAALENAPAELRQSLSMQSIRKLILLCLIATISAGVSTGCVYRINIQQGNHIDPDAVDQLQQGMTKSQVQFLLGTPMIQDPFHPDRWDYVFYYKRGRDRNVEKKRLIVFFDEDVVREIVRDAPFDS